MADGVSTTVLPRNRLLSSQNEMTLPALSARGKKRSKSRPPHVKRLLSANVKYIYSVDDDVNDGPDQDPLYLEGYIDALRRRRLEAEEEPEPPQEPVAHATSSAIESRAVEAESPDVASDAESTHLTLSMESLTLRDRQQAINTTHPFGIKIWKPSLYKKSRSVAARAEEDIHDYKQHKPSRIYWGVHLSNILWSVLVGLLLCFVCFVGAAGVFASSALHKKLRPYLKLLVLLGLYWLWPFGKFVLLIKDGNYLEDELDGRSISEFHNWRRQEEGRLFFAPPRRLTNSGESRPLLKDHKGRNLRDAYSLLAPEENAVEENENDEGVDIKTRFFGRGTWSFGRIMFYVFFYGVLQPLLYAIAIICWLFVFTIPMAKLTTIMCDHLRRRPLALHFEHEKTYYERVNDPNVAAYYKELSIILCTYRSCGSHYYKYTIEGTNIFFINLLSVVVFVILDFFLLKETFEWNVWFTDSSFVFCTCLFSIIPLAYFIGQAVASISAQSSMGVGAVINAFFSTVVEIFLYCVALNQGKGKLVEGSMIGSILGGVLLLPGLSMCGGALKRKTQRYNPRSAGVSSTMLLFAMVVMFAPSLFYQMYGTYELQCATCDISAGSSEECSKCRFFQPLVSLDTLFYQVLRPFSLLVAVALFLAYVCGLFFTLRTHASLIWATSHETPLKKDPVARTPSIMSLDQIPTKKASILDQPGSARASDDKRNKVKIQQPVKEEEPESGGHDAPNWSRNKSTIILLGATLLYAIIAEILVDTVDDVLSNFPINPKFLGLTVFALVPNTTEFVNAILFAIGGNVALSMEIGSAYALQVVLIQIPCLVLYSVYQQFDDVSMMFSLVFPRWDIVATLISIYLFTYIYAEGKLNYFKGVILILIYLVVMAGFYLDDRVAELGAGQILTSYINTK